MKEETPRANRFYIGLFGRRNSGKSSLVNALTGQDTAIVSDVDVILTGDKDFLSLEMDHPRCMTAAQFLMQEGLES